MSRAIQLLFISLLIAGCAAQDAFREGRELIEAGNIEEGLARVQEASKLDPGNPKYRTYYLRQRDLLVQRSLILAENARRAKLFNDADKAYRHALSLDPTNARARMGLEILQADRRHSAMLEEAEALFKRGDLDGAYAKAKEILAENTTHRGALALLRQIEEENAKAGAAKPRLGAALRKVVTLEFREATLRSAFELLSKHAGLNFVLDRDVRPDQRTTIFLKQTTIADALHFLLATNQLERKVINENTVLIYPDTPAKRREHKELMVRSFYLANADVKQTANMIRSLIRTRDLFIDEKLNLLVIRDTPEAVRLAEKLVAAQDLAEPEVMLEVEVLEVGSQFLRDLGVQWPGQVLFQDPATVSSAPGTLQSLSAPLKGFIATPALILNLLQTDGSTNVLANPRIRVKNRDKARIHIGDKVPVITTTTTATGFAAESVSYLDVGLKLEVEPTVSLENDVGIKVELEVSRIVQEIRSSTGTLAPQVGTRNAATTLRLANGETQVLAGLITDEERKSATKVPGLGDLPVVGRLFGSTRDTVDKTEIVLLITPHIIRRLARPGMSLEKFMSGTEASLGGGGMPGPSFVPPPSPPPPPPARQPTPPSTTPFGPYKAPTPGR